MGAPNLRSVDATLPDPPYPPHIKSNGWKPEFDISLIETSETWVLAEDDERPWLLRIWYEAWKSVPVGSMPQSRRMFARRIGCTRTFLDVHAEIFLRGWVLHSDDNLYHAHISSQVNAMLDKRLSTKKKVAEWRGKKKQRDGKKCNPNVTGYQPVSNPPEQEQEQEQEEKRKEAKASSAIADATTPGDDQNTPRQKTPYKEILALYREMLPTCEQPLDVEHWTPARKGTIRARWNNQLPDLDSWRECFSSVARSRFLTGQAEPCNGRKVFRASLFWIAKPENLLKIYEGKYDG